MTICGGVTIGGIIAIIAFLRPHLPLAALAALVFCGIGDAILNLDPAQDWIFPAGIATFAAAQICFIIFARQRQAGGHSLMALTLFSGYTAYYAAVILPNAPNLLTAALALAYMLLSVTDICVSAALPRNYRGRNWIIAAVAALLISDTIISLSVFGQLRWLNPVMLPLYALSQLLYALGVIIGEKNAVTPTEKSAQNQTADVMH